MTMTDPIADMLTRIRNALRASHEVVDIPSSRMKLNLIKVLKAEGYLKNFKIVNERNRKLIRVFLKYDESGRPVIEGLTRVSKPSCRVYRGYEDIPMVLNGLGVSLISTSKGVMSDRQARDERVGGEVICSVW